MKLASTKVQGFWFVMVTSPLLLAFDKITDGTYLGLVTIAFGIFSVVNVAQKKVYSDGHKDSR